MCGRFTLTFDAQVIADLFGVGRVPALEPRYNIAPSQPVLAIREAEDGTGREIVPLCWGLVPHWAEDPAIGNKLINARAETAAEKPSFRSSFRDRRCLIPADGFFEWSRRSDGKQPYLIRLKDGRPCAFAGLWDRWEGRDGEVIESCAVLTVDANDLVRPWHDRMPAIMATEDFSRWLGRGVHDSAAVRALLRPYPAADMEAYPVARYVNDARREGPECVVEASLPSGGDAPGLVGESW